jgi:asparagine synthase (glutamine-hydrolysing)
MCGICGIYKFNNSEINIEKCKKMLDSLYHRGPDNTNYHLEKKIFLGSSRLKIQDLRSNGNMPIESDNSFIINNGEIYNFIELKDKFKLNCNSNSDTEVVLKLYQKIKLDFLSELNGIYAFTIYDSNEIICVRDRLGVKPFFYYQDEKKIIYASEIKAILQYGIKAEPNNKIISQYLKYGVYDHSNETFFKNIYQLPAAHYMKINENGIQIEKYWDLEEETKDNKSLEQIISEFKFLINDSIKMQLRSDVPVALNLSGGIDSTLMSYIVNSLNNGQQNYTANTYFFNSDNDDKLDSLDLVQSLNWNSNLVQLLPSDIPLLMNELMISQEQPFPGIVTFAKHKLLKSIKEHTVILEGQGGDDIAAGYQYVFGSFIQDLINENKILESELEINKFSEINNISIDKTRLKVESGIKAINSFGWSADCSNYLRPNCFNQDLINKYNLELKFPQKFKSNLKQFQYRDLFYTKLPRILRTCDRASMYHSKELRVPILDHRIVKLCFNAPSEFKIKNGEQRYFYRQAFKDIVPDNILKKPKKAVTDPQSKWFSNELKDWILEIINSESFKNREFFNQTEILNEYQNFIKNKGNNSFFIWQFISLEFWYRNFID